LIVGIYVTYFVLTFDDIYQKRLSLKILKKIRLAALQKSTGFFLCILSMFAIFLCQDNSTLRLSRTIKKATSEQPFGFSVVPATFQPFVFPMFGR
jgi:hypothetical protein